MCTKDDNSKPTDTNIQPDPELQVPLKKGTGPKADACLQVTLKAGEPLGSEDVTLTERSNSHD